LKVVAATLLLRTSAVFALNALKTSKVPRIAGRGFGE
jgi:hypothetical protein